MRLRVPVASAEPADSEPWGLDLLDATIGGSLWLHRATVWNSGVRLSHLRIGRNLECIDLLPMRDEDAPGAQPAGNAGPVASSDAVERRSRVSVEIAFAKIGMLLLWKAAIPGHDVVTLAGSTVGTFE